MYKRVMPVRYENYDQFIARKRREYGDKFDASDLNPEFVKYFNSQERIEVKFSYGEVKRGRIGVTTRWKPAFLLMLTLRSRGSSDVIGEGDHVVRVIY